MASPFSIFRRNQKVMLAVVSVLAMFAFVFLDPIFKMLGGARGPENPVVVKTNFGSFKAIDLAHENLQRNTVANFLQRLVVARVRKAIEEKQLPEQMGPSKADDIFNFWRDRLMGRISPTGDAATVETLVLAHRAEQLGIVVNDLTVNKVIYMITENKVPAAELQDILNSMHSEGRTGVSQSYIFDGLAREVAASMVCDMFKLGTVGLFNRPPAGMPPAQRFDYFTDLNRKATARVIPIKVESFLKDVPEPKDDQLQAFYERHRNQMEDPLSPEPGFKEPAKIAFQYFKANLEAFSKRATESITEEEMLEYYEKNKAIQFRTVALPEEKDSSTQPAAESDVAPEGQPASETAPAEGKTPADGNTPAEKPAQPAAEVEKPASAAAPAAPAQATPGNATPAAATPAKAGPATAAPATATPVKPAPKAPAGGQKPAAPAVKKSSQLDPLPAANPFRLTGTALAADDATPATGEKNTAEKNAVDQKTAPAASTKSDTTQAANNAAKSETAPTEPAADAAADSKGKYMPFEKVKEEIRSELARRKSQQQIDSAFEKLSAKVREYGRAIKLYRTTKEDNPDLEPPQPLKLGDLAKEVGMTAHEIEPISAYQAANETELGHSSTYIRDERMGFRTISFTQMAFTDPRLYRPEITFDEEQNRFLWWETESLPEAAPSFEDVRSKVLHAYKMQGARELAMKQAEVYVKEAKAATDKTLEQLFADRPNLEVIDTGSFSHLTLGNVPFDPESPNFPEISPVHGVDAPGQDFMNAVFSLKPGQVTAAFNQPQNTAYVIQVDNYEPAMDSLEHQFLLEPLAKYVRVAFDDERRLYLNWISSLESDAGVQWLEAPRVSSRNGE